MKEQIAKILAKSLNKKEEEIINLIEIPPSPELGDFAFPCFSLAKEMRKNPVEIAKELKEKIKLSNEIERIEVKGAYLNFFLNKTSFAEDILKQILKEKEKYGRGKEKEKVMVEYETPNTNKPLHLGHLRNASIGRAISNLLEFTGNKVIKADLYNDRGVHICKSMYALEYLSKKKFPDKKSDHFVGDLYVLFNNKAKDSPELENKVQEMLQKWEAGDKKTLALWKKIDSWATKGIEETDKLFGNKFDVYFRETEFYKKAKPIIKLGLKKGVFSKDEEGNIIVKLEPELPNKVVQRKDGTSIYITNDIALVPHKFERYKINKSLWVVGNEQNLYFQQLFKIFELLGYKWTRDCKHLSYGMVFLPEGRMKSREGTVIDADDFIEEIKVLSKKEIKKRFPELKDKELESRSLKIALSAIKYFFLKIDINKDMVFNPEESISFEGNTGPYLLYSYARASSIIKKSKKKAKLKDEEIESKEAELIKKLGEFPEIIQQAEKQLNPAVIANYSFQLSQAFNEFYHSSKVIDSDKEEFLLALVESFRIIIKSSLSLLGIDVIEEM